MGAEAEERLIVYTGGTFDLFHAGHSNFLKACSRFGRVVVALNTDEFVQEYKGRRPVCSFSERADVLLSCVWVHEVVQNTGGMDSRPSIEEVKPQIIAIGSDWATRDYYKQMGFDQAWLDDRGIMLLYIPYTKGISSSEIKSRMSKAATSSAD